MAGKDRYGRGGCSSPDTYVWGQQTFPLWQWWATFLPPRATKALPFLSRAALITQAKARIIFIHIISFPLETWWAAQELLAGLRLPTPALW